MKILVNTATLRYGGGVQVAINFIDYTVSVKEHTFRYVLSSEVSKQLSPKTKDAINSYTAEISPAQFRKGSEVRKTILGIEQEFDPDIVYSVGAPSYISFKNIEVLRLTNPLVIGGARLAYTTYPLVKRLIEKAGVFVKRFYVTKKHYVITQTETAKNLIVKNIGIHRDKVFVVSNVYSPIFDNDIEKETNPDQLNILVFAAPYLHKNLDLVPRVAHELVKRGITNFKFTVTIPEENDIALFNNFEDSCRTLNVDSYIENIGKVNFKSAPYLYKRSDILFLPTLLEVFSVTYLESMASSVPIVTTDLPFSNDVCRDSAHYFKPKDALSAANSLEKLIKSEEEREKLIKKGKKRLLDFPKYDEVFGEHIKVLEHINNKVLT